MRYPGGVEHGLVVWWLNVQAEGTTTLTSLEILALQPTVSITPGNADRIDCSAARNGPSGELFPGRGIGHGGCTFLQACLPPTRDDATERGAPAQTPRQASHFLASPPLTSILLLILRTYLLLCQSLATTSYLTSAVVSNGSQAHHSHRHHLQVHQHEDEGGPQGDQND